MADSAQTSSVEPDDEAESVAPGSGAVVPDRFSSDEVFQRIVADADHELTAGRRELFFSALAAGFAITITFLVYASMSAASATILAASLLYPLGFIYIIIGDYQLYTENTLPPVLLTLERLASIPSLLRHWLIVLLGNFIGAALGAIALSYGDVFDPATTATAVDLAEKGMATDPWALFFKGLFAGLIVAGVVWIDFAARDTISRVIVVYLAFLAIPLGGLFHVVVSFTEAVFLILESGAALWPTFGEFVFPVLLGNTIGGVVLVSVINYYQTSERRLEVERFENVRRLTLREWLVGSLAGRSYVPMIDTIEEIVRDEDCYRILVPVTNPRMELEMVRFGCRIADAKEAGRVHAVHVVESPKHFGEGDREAHDRITEESERLMADIRDLEEGYDVTVETSTLVTPRSFEAIFDRARRMRPDLVLLGWGDEQVWTSARAERPLRELTNRLPSDFLIVQDRGLDPSNILLPTAGGPDSDLSAEVAAALASGGEASVTLLHVVTSAKQRAAGQAFLTEWAEDHDLEDATLVVDDSGDIEGAIEREATDATMIMMGATERGLLRRLIRGSLHFKIVTDVDCTVVLAERPRPRSLWQRLFGRGKRRKNTVSQYAHESADPDRSDSEA